MSEQQIKELLENIGYMRAALNQIIHVLEEMNDKLDGIDSNIIHLNNIIEQVNEDELA